MNMRTIVYMNFKYVIIFSKPDSGLSYNLLICIIPNTIFMNRKRYSIDERCCLNYRRFLLTDFFERQLLRTIRISSTII